MSTHLNLNVCIPEKLAFEVMLAAKLSGVSIEDLVIETLNKTFLKEIDNVDSSSENENGYLWKNVFLPAGTQLSFKFKGSTYFATVINSKIMHEGKSVSPSEFVNNISGVTRNAWREIWLKRPSDKGWLAVKTLRNELLGRSSDIDEPIVLKKMEKRYISACIALSRIIDTESASIDDFKDIEEAKGMFNRVARHDQLDWRHVESFLGRPHRNECERAALWLSDLRSRLKNNEPLEDHFRSDIVEIVKTSIRSAIDSLVKPEND
jgi:hypothetical protein